jgi:hypothetical protein
VLVAHVRLQRCAVLPELETEDRVVVQGCGDHVVQATRVGLSGLGDLADRCDHSLARAVDGSGSGGNKKHDLLPDFLVTKT